MTINDIIAGLRNGVRQGAETDEPEGARYIFLSDTLANRMADCLDAWLKDERRSERR